MGLTVRSAVERRGRHGSGLLLPADEALPDTGHFTRWHSQHLHPTRSSEEADCRGSGASTAPSTAPTTPAPNQLPSPRKEDITILAMKGKLSKTVRDASLTDAILYHNSPRHKVTLLQRHITQNIFTTPYHTYSSP